MKTKPLATPTKNEHGFNLVEFKDAYGVPCSLQASGLAKMVKPGTSAIWLGTHAQPKVFHGRARELGIKTDATSGWVPYPIPDDVLLSTRMHLERKQVESLVKHLQNWLKTGKF